MSDVTRSGGFGRQNPHLLLALALTLAFHGGLLFYTFKRTYDAYVHIFFADHYARSWFDHWEYRWYTGFTMTSYPPGAQQATALLAPLIGLQNGYIVVQITALLVVVIGVYRFARLWVSEEAAGYAALLAALATSITETVHVFGQLPTTFSLGLLLNALPYAYRWLDQGHAGALLTAWALNAATTAGHHVTTLFGAVFFMGPVFALAIVGHFRRALPDEPGGRPSQLTRENVRALVVRRLRRITPVTGRSTLYGVGLVALLVFVVLPYWLWSRADPITQVPIPHASRDSYLANPNAGLVFWLIPYGVGLLTLPYAVYKGLRSHAWPLTLSLLLLFVLGTGGTTPLPRLLLRGGYDILTLDRFTFWATILLLPFQGEFVRSVRHGRLAHYLREQFGRPTWRAVQAGLVLAYVVAAVFTANLTQFRRFQPDPLDMQPIVRFLEKDQHSRWRYLTLGFGDQLAWLAAQTTATTVDGNYHSARRLPELTSTPVERLEGAKFRGVPGIGSLQQFLTVPEKYHLKFVFSNDPFYDPLLFFAGWHRVQTLENGVVVWEREDIPPSPMPLPRQEIPLYQRLLWGIVPLTAVAAAGLAVFVEPRWRPRRRPRFARLAAAWSAIDSRLRGWSELRDEGPPAEQALSLWPQWAGWRWPAAPAAPSARLVRSGLLALVVVAGAATVTLAYVRQARTPAAVLTAFYDDLDFRRFERAYYRLDPASRPSYEQFLLELSVDGGLLASYAKLDAVAIRPLASEFGRRELLAETTWITALDAYSLARAHTLVRRNGRWYILPAPVDVAVPPDQFFRQPAVAWQSQGRRRVTTETTAFDDVLDRPELQILSARLVLVNDRYSLVGELINTDADPADVTVTAVLLDDAGEVLTWYNAQDVMIHKILPKEVTPFRIDFEGVAGARLAGALDFTPDAFTPPEFQRPVAAFELYAKAVVTGRDLRRDLGAQDLAVTSTADGRMTLLGTLYNAGTREASVPHVLVTYYDAQQRVVWVDDHYLPQAIRPQRSREFELPLRPAEHVVILIDQGELYANILQNEVPDGADWRERLPLPPSSGYASLRVSQHYFSGPES